MRLPKVSIVIPVYNGGDYLAQAIDSALAQTYEHVEVIVVNDGSNDNGVTERIAMSYGDKLRYFSKPNGGVSSALNVGIREMTGEYFSWLSHDDLYTPEKVENAIIALHKAGEIDKRTIVLSDGYYIDHTGRTIKPFSARLSPGKVYTGIDVVEYLVQHGTLNGCCMLIPKIAFDECGGFDECLRYSQDAFMWFKMFLAGYRLLFDGCFDVMYRQHQTQTSHTKHELFEKDAGYIAEKLAPMFREISTKSDNYLYRYALRMARYRCANVVHTMSRYANDDCKFSLIQKMKLSAVLLYGSVRGTMKTIYYRYFLGVKI